MRGDLLSIGLTVNKGEAAYHRYEDIAVTRTYSWRCKTITEADAFALFALVGWDGTLFAYRPWHGSWDNVTYPMTLPQKKAVKKLRTSLRAGKDRECFDEFFAKVIIAPIPQQITTAKVKSGKLKGGKNEK